MDPIADLLLAAAAACFAGMGLLALARPARVVGRFGLDAATRDARNEVRAVYGGFGVAAAALLAFAAATEGRGELWIPSILAVLCFGIAVGRVVSWALDRTVGSRVTWTWFGVEVGLAVALFGSHTLR